MLAALLLPFVMGIESYAHPLDSSANLTERAHTKFSDLRLSELSKRRLSADRLWGNLPPPEFSTWVALGDSYAAGPGAGYTAENAPLELTMEERDQYRCLQGTEAYPLQMYHKRVEYRQEQIAYPNFRACTGDTTEDLLDQKNTNYQMAVVTPELDFITLSLGGNDVNFSGILKKCVYSLPGGRSCDDLMDRARKILYGQDFYGRYVEIITTVLEKMEWANRAYEKLGTAIYTTGYPLFFDEWTDQCDHIHFPLPKILSKVAGVKVTKDLRTKMNILTAELGVVEQYWLDYVNWKYTAPQEQGKKANPINLVDLDFAYTEHRFCRMGVKEPIQDPKTWFFHLDSSRGVSTLLQEALTMMVSNIKDDLSLKWLTRSYHGTLSKAAFVNIMKVFHPTSDGHGATSKMIAGTKLNPNALDVLQGLVVPVTVIGDDIPCGGQLPTSQNQFPQGFITELVDILEDDNVFQMPPKITFKGTRSETSTRQGMQVEVNECYPGASLTKIQTTIMQKTAEFNSKTVILFSAGSIDIQADNANPDDLINITEDILMTLHNANAKKDSVILVAQIPILGYNQPGDSFNPAFTPLQRRIIDFNARLTQLVNRLMAQEEMRIVKVRLSTTTFEHVTEQDLGRAPTDNERTTFPSISGYQRMAQDYLEALRVAAGAGWFDVDEHSCEA